MTQALGQEIVITSDRYTLEGMVLCICERHLSRFQINLAISGAELQFFDFAAFNRRQTVTLALADFSRRDFNQLFRAAFANQNGNFIGSRLSPILSDELLNGFVPLVAALTVLREQIVGNAANLETRVASLHITPILDFKSQRTHLPRESIAVNLREVCSAVRSALLR